MRKKIASMTKYDTEYPEPVTGALILNEDDDVFLMKSPKWDDQWVVPGGHVEKGETIENVSKERSRKR
jgi:NUDIX domain.